MSKYIVLSIVVLIVFGCNKKKNPTRAIPTYSLNFNGNYYESFTTTNQLHKYENFISPDGFVHGYVVLIPILNFVFRCDLQRDTLYSNQSFSKYNGVGHTPYETYNLNGFEGLLGYYGNAIYGPDSNFVFHINTVTANEAEGYFYGNLIRANPADTIKITNGQFNHIVINN